MSKYKKLIIFFSIIFIAWLIWSNITFKVSKYTIESDRLPKRFDGYRIVQISDLHNAKFGKNNKNLVKRIKKEKPDMIAITGDFVDGFNPKIDNALKFAEELIKIAPCYYVSGNHEVLLAEDVYSDFVSKMKELGVVVLENDLAMLEKNGEKIQIIGFADQRFWGENPGDDVDGFSADNMMDSDYGYIESNTKVNSDLYTIALEHRPTFLNYFAKKKTDLVLSGHAHGGQFRIPFIGGVVAPDQGFFPKYYEGKYTKDNTTMIVSTGLGNSVIPVRVNNRPELVVIELKCK